MSSLTKCLILGLAILLISNFGCDVFKVGEVIDNGNEKEECKYPLYPATGNVGDTIRSCHFEVTLHKAEYIDIEYRGPRVKVEATIKLLKAVSGKGAQIFTDSFTFQDTNGKIYSWDGLGGNDMIQQVTLTEGQTVSGSTTIQVDKNASGFTAIFRESKMMTGSINYEDILKWKLGF